jgi:single stranded DNA-binding protein
MNTSNLTGRWVSDAKVSDVGGKKKAEARIAVNVGKDKTHFFGVVFWEKAAELAETYLKKGEAAAVSGRLVQDTWEKEGEKREKVYIAADRFEFAVSDKKSDSDSGKSESPAKPAKNSKKEEKSDDEDLW